ncbi:MAG: phytanoyl-CoA dioxygenase family protein [Acidobacteriota bacterium]
MSPSNFPATGFALVPEVFSAAECETLAALAQPSDGASRGTRSLLQQPWCAALAERLRAHPVLSALIPADLAAVQCTYFEKSAARNWLVPFHQDLSIPVAERVEAPGLRGWSKKEGGLFVQPPVTLLEQMLAVRLHLDACSENDGPLRVVPGSHLEGRLEPEGAARARAHGTEVACIADAGAAVVLRPLLLHASSKATGESRRRVLHFVFGPRELPFGLRWPISTP